MEKAFDGIVELFERAAWDFAARVLLVRRDQWCWPTPCPEWSVRKLVNHLARGNLNYALLCGGTRVSGFLRPEDEDALGTDPVAALGQSVRVCAAAFRVPGVLAGLVDYPLGEISGARALALLTADTVVHTWDLARAISVDETLDADLVSWIDAHLVDIYGGLPEMPAAEATTHLVFDAPVTPQGMATRQQRLLNLTGRVV